MRLAILTATRHGETAPVVLQDASVGIVEQKASFKAFAVLREHPEFCEVQLWTSDGGIISKRKLKAPAEAAAPEDPEAAKAAAEAKAAKAEAKAAKAKAAADAKAAKAKAKAGA